MQSREYIVLYASTRNLSRAIRHGFKPTTLYPLVREWFARTTNIVTRPTFDWPSGDGVPIILGKSRV